MVQLFSARTHTHTHTQTEKLDFGCAMHAYQGEESWDWDCHIKIFILTDFTPSAISTENIIVTRINVENILKVIEHHTKQHQNNLLIRADDTLIRLCMMWSINNPLKI
jgi:hypothetical protein